MKYTINHTTKYAYSDAVPVCHNLVRLTPRALDYQSCAYSQLLVHPEPTEVTHRLDYFGNRLSYFSINQAHYGLTVSANSHVIVKNRPNVDSFRPIAWENVVEGLKKTQTPEALEAYQFSVASKRIAPFEALVEYVSKSFTKRRSIQKAAMELTERVYDDFTYDTRATTVHTPIEEVFEKRHGVCQDFAHLQIGCLRSIGIPARYVSGYLRTAPPPGKKRLVGADASHAWLSVYCGEEGWIDFDPTNSVVCSDDHITVAWGRDYSDVSPIQGVITGGGEHRMEVSVDVAPAEEA